VSSKSSTSYLKNQNMSTCKS